MAAFLSSWRSGKSSIAIRNPLYLRLGRGVTPPTPLRIPPCRQNVGPLMSTKNRQRGDPGVRGVGPSQYVDFFCYSISKHIRLIRNDSPGSYLEPMRNQTTNFDVPLMFCSKEVRNKNLIRPENVIIDIFLIQYDTNKNVSK